MNGYLAFFNGKQIEVFAETSFQAQQQAAKQLKVKPKDAYKVTVMLAEKDRQQVTHSTAAI